MGVKISGVERHSPAAKAGLQVGETLLQIDSNEIEDVLDYRFYIWDWILRPI